MYPSGCRARHSSARHASGAGWQSNFTLYHSTLSSSQCRKAPPNRPSPPSRYEISPKRTIGLIKKSSSSVLAAPCIQVRSFFFIALMRSGSFVLMDCSRCRYGTVPVYTDANKAYPTFQTVSILLTFFLAMLMNPDAQTKAQEEIDRVIGTDRLPTFDDESKLPYVSALSKEVFRWQQVAPFGMSSYSLHISMHPVNFLPCFPAIPHRLIEDDFYNGYFLPKNSIVLGNAWCALSLSLSALLAQHTRFTAPFLPGESCTTTGSSPIPSHSSRSALSGPT